MKRMALFGSLLMRYPFALIVRLLLVGIPVCAALGAGAAQIPGDVQGDRDWAPLFDGKSLHGWYPKIQNQKTGEDPEKYFQVDDGVIHVYKDQAAGTKVPNGYLATEKEYANYRLRMEYKWGTKKFQPRMMAVRDAGLLYHVTAPDSVWPRCIECQIQENDVGDCFTVRGVRLTTSVEVVPIQTPGGVKKLPRYKPEAAGGATQKLGDSGIVRIVKSSTHEHEGWNTIELAVRGSQGSEHMVNGETVFRATELKELGAEPLSKPLKKGEVDPRKWEPLARGRIALQCEYSEVFYRKIEIRKEN
jgi:3-keto-disaccharide hydrolase